MSANAVNKGKNIVIFISAAVFVLTAVLDVLGSLDALNNALANAAHSLETSALTVFMKIVTNTGEWYVYVPLALLLLAVPKWRRGIGFPAASVLAVSSLLNWSLKQLFAIPRPNTHRLIAETGFGFPSGHAMIGTSFVLACVLLFARYSSNKPLKTAFAVFALFFTLAVGFSRVYLGVHNPADIVGGYAMGIFVCLVVTRIFERLGIIHDD